MYCSSWGQARSYHSYIGQWSGSQVIKMDLHCISYQPSSSPSPITVSASVSFHFPHSCYLGGSVPACPFPCLALIWPRLKTVSVRKSTFRCCLMKGCRGSLLTVDGCSCRLLNSANSNAGSSTPLTAWKLLASPILWITTGITKHHQSNSNSSNAVPFPLDGSLPVT